MSTLAGNVLAAPSPPPSRLTVEQYHGLIEAGALTKDDRVELVEGVLVSTMATNPGHALSVDLVADVVRPLLPPGWRYRPEKPVTLADGEPQPDGAVTCLSVADLASRHPMPADLALVVEVSDTTLAADRRNKLRTYARAGIRVYWIVNLIDRQVEVHTDPDPAARPEPTYRSRTVYAGGEGVPLSVGGVALPAVVVSSILPPV